MDREYTITSIVEKSDSQFGKRVRFRISDYEKEVSCFTKFPDNMIEGAKIYGHVEIKDGKYHNFRFGKRDSSPAANAGGAAAELKNVMTLKIIPMLEKQDKQMSAIWGRLGLILKAQGIKVETDYPQQNETNDAHGLDEVPF